MKLNRIVAVAALVASPAFAAPFVDFEKAWDAGIGDINGYYGGGTAADGTSGPNLGITFIGVSGLSNDAAGPYFANAPTPLGVAYVFDPGAKMNIAGGAYNHLSFFYSSPVAVVGAIEAFAADGITSLGKFDLDANSSTSYDEWDQVTFLFSGIAYSFNLGASIVGQDVNGENFGVLFDNVSAVPEPETYPLVIVGLGLLGFVSRRKKQNSA